MKNDINKMLIRILMEVFLGVIIIIECFIFCKDIVNAREKVIDIQGNLSINVLKNSDYIYLYPINDKEADSTILEISNTSNDSINYKLLLRMNIIDNVECYKVMLSGKTYRLTELEYYEEGEYRYFNLGNYLIGNKKQNFTFLLWLSDEVDFCEITSIKYSFLVVE